MFLGIHIDLLFAQLGLPQIREELDLSNDDLLRGLDEPGVRSLNGTSTRERVSFTHKLNEHSMETRLKSYR